VTALGIVGCYVKESKKKKKLFLQNSSLKTFHAKKQKVVKNDQLSRLDEIRKVIASSKQCR
jgi:hypothetical protein